MPGNGAPLPEQVPRAEPLSTELIRSAAREGNEAPTVLVGTVVGVSSIED